MCSSNVSFSVTCSGFLFPLKEIFCMEFFNSCWRCCQSKEAQRCLCITGDSSVAHIQKVHLKVNVFYSVYIDAVFADCKLGVFWAAVSPVAVMFWDSFLISPLLCSLAYFGLFCFALGFVLVFWGGRDGCGRSCFVLFECWKHFPKLEGASFEVGQDVLAKFKNYPNITQSLRVLSRITWCMD